MVSLFIVAGILIFLAVVAGVYVAITGTGEARGKVEHQYTAKKYFLTRAEHEFYNALGQAVGHDYRIFAQVSLGSILDEKVKGQPWKAARAHIDRKSVDFLLCDKEYLSPKLAIELDDKSHEREDRRERDIEVERILQQVGLPLLRVANHGQFSSTELADHVREAVSQK